MIEILAALCAAGAMFCFVIGLFWDFEQGRDASVWGRTGRWLQGDD